MTGDTILSHPINLPSTPTNKIMHVDGYGILAATIALALNDIGYPVVFTPRGPLGAYRVSGMERLEECGVERDVAVRLLPLPLRSRVRRGLRETHRLYRVVLERLVAEAIPIVPAAIAYAARNTIHIRIGLCEDLPTDTVAQLYECGGRVEAKPGEGCTPLGACVSRSTIPSKVIYGSTVTLAPPAEDQTEAICEVLRGLGPHTAQH